MALSNNYVTLMDGQSGTGAGDTLPTDSAEATYVTMEVIIGNTATVTFEGSVRGDEFYTVEARDLGGNQEVSTTNSTGVFRINAGGLAAVRPNVTAHTSGDVTVYAHSQYQ